jgi:hypothetical protein
VHLMCRWQVTRGAAVGGSVVSTASQLPSPSSAGRAGDVNEMEVEEGVSVASAATPTLKLSMSRSSARPGEEGVVEGVSGLGRDAGDPLPTGSGPLAPTSDGDPDQVWIKVGGNRRTKRCLDTIPTMAGSQPAYRGEVAGGGKGGKKGAGLISIPTVSPNAGQSRRQGSKATGGRLWWPVRA